MHTFLFYNLVDVLNHLCLRIFVAAHKDRHVCNAIQQIRIAHQRYRSRINDDIVIPLAQLRKQRIQPLCLQ